MKQARKMLDYNTREFVRVPGLFRRWELEDVLEVGSDFHLEEAGETTDGTQLLAVYWRRPADEIPR